MTGDDWDLDRTVRTFRNDVLVREVRYYKCGSYKIVYEDPNLSFDIDGDIIDDDDDDVGSADNSEDDGDIDEDETREERLERIFESLSSAAGFEGVCTAVDEISGERMQASALHGDDGKEIQVTHSLIWSSTDDELAFIIGHEIAHHMNNDHDRHKEVVLGSLEDIAQDLDTLNHDMKQKGRGAIRRGLTLAGSVILKAGAHSQRVREASRTHEEEADRRAVDLIVRAGYDTSGVESVLRKLHGGELPDIGYFNTLISTHPNPATRARRALARTTKK